MEDDTTKIEDEEEVEDEFDEDELRDMVLKDIDDRLTALEDKLKNE